MSWPFQLLPNAPPPHVPPSSAAVCLGALPPARPWRCPGCRWRAPAWFTRPPITHAEKTCTSAPSCRLSRLSSLHLPTRRAASHNQVQVLLNHSCPALAFTQRPGSSSNSGHPTTRCTLAPENPEGQLATMTPTYQRSWRMGNLIPHTGSAAHSHVPREVPRSRNGAHTIAGGTACELRAEAHVDGEEGQTAEGARA